jgi:acetoin utilization deacetylase AcuC-like enzyme
MTKIQKNIIDYSIGDRIKSLLIIASNVLLRYKSLPIKNIDGKEVINWFLEALISEIALLLNVSKSDYIEAVKELISSAEKSFLEDKTEEAVEFISTAISKATTQAAKAIEALEKIWKTDA